MEYTPVVIMLVLAVASLVVSVVLVWRWMNKHRAQMKEEMAQLSAMRPKRSFGGAGIAGQLANSAEDLAYADLQQQKKAEPFERLEKPLYAMHQQMEELLAETRGLRSDIGEFLAAHRKTLKVLLGQDEYDGGDPDQKAEEDEVARLLRRYPQLSRNDALARVREQAQYKTGGR